MTADDLGMSPGVNRGILEAHQAGCVTSASLLVNGPGFADAIARLPAAPELSLGLHLNLTAGTPVAPPRAVPSLWHPRTGAFYPLPRFVRRALAGLIRSEHVAIESAAQLGRLRDAGISITHLDSHHHVHMLAPVWRPVLRVARQAGIRAVRVPLEPLIGSRLNIGGLVKQLGIRSAWRVASAVDDGADVRIARFRGMQLQGVPRFLDRLLLVLDQLPAGMTEVMVHPGYVDDELSAWDSYTVHRELELAALCSPSLAARFARGDIALGPLCIR